MVLVSSKAGEEGWEGAAAYATAKAGLVGLARSLAQIGGTGWKTSLFPKDGRYIVPVKAWVGRPKGLS